jgi:hypothetical protein
MEKGTGSRRSTSVADACSELSKSIVRERQLLESLLYRLEVQRLILTAGRTHLLETSAREVEQVVDRIASAELGRGIAATELAEALTLGEEPPLSRIAAAAPSPWDVVLQDNLKACRRVMDDITRISADNRVLISRGQRETEQLIDLVTTVATGETLATTYSRAGTTSKTRTRGVHRIDTGI